MRRLMIVAILTFCGLSHVWAQYPDPFLSDEERPNGLYFLQAPPENSTENPDGRFSCDMWYYKWGKDARDNHAAWDEGAELLSEEGDGVYNDIMGLYFYNGKIRMK